MSSRGKFAGLAYDCDRSVFQTRLGRLDDRVGEIAEKRKKSLGRTSCCGSGRLVQVTLAQEV
jgi:hypothetical protein